jgi:hypothetical protein
MVPALKADCAGSGLGVTFGRATSGLGTSVPPFVRRRLVRPQPPSRLLGQAAGKSKTTGKWSCVHHFGDCSEAVRFGKEIRFLPLKPAFSRFFDHRSGESIGLRLEVARSPWHNDFGDDYAVSRV